jgi:hypothetical protein
MRELEIGERVEIEDFRGIVAWHGQITRAGGNVIVITDEQAPPAELKPNAPVRVNFSEGRWLTKARGRVLERVERGLKILIVGQDERVQRRSHVRVAVNQATQIAVASGGAAPRIVDAEIVDISEGGCRVRCGQPVAAADAVELAYDLDGATIRLTGQVVSAWHDAGCYTAGIRATSMSPGARGLIARYVIARSLATSPTRAQPTRP